VAKVRKSAKSSTKARGATMSRRAEALRAFIEAMPGAVPHELSMGRTTDPVALIHKVQGKMFAIQALRGEEHVVLKCDPVLAHALRQKYEGVGHRSHLDRRFWIAVNINADVPMKEVKRLVDHSYGQVRAGLTRKQQAELDTLCKSQ
jgi:predicted DNA-binding protein (MmcQ/YjbR family)